MVGAEARPIFLLTKEHLHAHGSFGNNRSDQPDPAVASSSFIHDEAWLAFNMIQTCTRYEQIPEAVAADYGRKPVKPVVMAEGGYEGLEFRRLQTAHHIRKQAYWSQLAGGHHIRRPAVRRIVCRAGGAVLHQPAGVGRCGALRHGLTPLPAPPLKERGACISYKILFI